MVVLGPADGQIEVRLVKAPFDAPEPVYFDEYEKLGTPHPEKLTYENSRYIASEDTAYTIEVTLKEGFSYGDFLGIWVRVHDKARKVQIGIRFFPKANKDVDVLDEDKKILISSLSQVIVDGKEKDNVGLAFSALATDETLSKETDVPGVEPADLGGFTIEIYKYGKKRSEHLSDRRFQKKQREFEAKLAAQASKIDESSFAKDGITHKVGLEGGVEKPLIPPKRKQWVHCSSESVKFNYMCRSLAFFEENAIFKCPIPLECQSWDSLSNKERQACFKSLQTYDKERVLMQKLSEAGPHADEKAIGTQLFELGAIPNRWRALNHLYKRERQPLFKELQLRRTFWEKGEVPPEDRKLKSETTPPTSRKQSKAILPSPTTIKEEPVDTPTLLQSKNPQPAIIVLDDSPPRSNKRSAASIANVSAPTIKTEPVDLDNHSPSALTSNKAGTEGGSPKKIKLELGVEARSNEDDKELVRLKEDEDFLNQEFQMTQRMLQLLAEKKEQKKRIAELEARASVTPGRGSRG